MAATVMVLMATEATLTAAREYPYDYYANGNYGGYANNNYGGYANGNYGGVELVMRL